MYCYSKSNNDKSGEQWTLEDIVGGCRGDGRDEQFNVFNGK